MRHPLTHRRKPKHFDRSFLLTLAGGAEFSPDDIEGLLLWLDADAITGLNHLDPVVTWEDQSGNGNDATQALAVRQPQYQTNVVNGLPAVWFNGGDFMAGNVGALNAPFTIVAVGYWSHVNQPSGDYDWWINIGDLTADNNVSISRHKANGANADKYTTYAATYYTGPVLTGQTWMILAATHKTSAPRHNLHWDGTAQVVNDYPNSLILDGVYDIGTWRNRNTHWLLGYLAEVLVYNSALSDAQRGNVESYLGTKYGISV